MSTKRLRFSREEFAARIERTRRAMEARGIEVLIATDPSNMNWLTGYDGWSFYVHQCVVLPLEGEPFWYGRGQDKAGARLMSWLADERIVNYPDHYVQSTERHPMDLLAKLLIDQGFGARTIGVEMDNYYFSAAAYAALQAGLPDARFADATALVNWQRAVKSEAELDYMRRAARITEAIHERILEKCEPGIRKCDLVAEIYDAGIRGADGHGGDYPAIVPLLPSGEEAAAAHLTWDDKPLRAGEATFFEVSGCYHRYHAPLCRTIYLGQPTDTFRRAEAALLEGMEAGLEQARPGNTCDDIARAFFSALGRHGIEKDSRAGYPIGLSYPPDWGERTMSIRRGDMSVLEEDMTFHFMTGLWMEDWGLEITESIRIGTEGPELFCSVPRKLFVKD